MRVHRGHLVSAKTLASCGRGGGSRRSDGHVAPSGTDGRVGNDELGKALELRHLLLEAGDGRSLGGIESCLLQIDGVLALLQRIDLRLEFFVHLNELLVGVLVCAEQTDFRVLSRELLPEVELLLCDELLLAVAAASVVSDSPPPCFFPFIMTRLYCHCFI